MLQMDFLSLWRIKVSCTDLINSLTSTECFCQTGFVVTGSKDSNTLKCISSNQQTNEHEG